MQLTNYKLAILIVLLALAPSLFAQGQQASLSNPLGGDIIATSSNCSVVLSCVWQKLPVTATTTTITISGTFVATLPIETSADGGVTFTTSSTQSAAAVVTLTTTSLTDVRVRASAYTSGKASVNIQTAGNQINITAGGGISSASISGNANAIYASPACPKPSSANCFFVNADGQYVSDAVYSNVSTACGTLTVPAGTCITSATANFKATDVGKIEYLTTGLVWQGNGVVDAQGTIIAYGGPTAVQISAAHASAGTGANFAWGTDDTANLQAAAAQLNTASATAPNTLILPAGGMMFVQAIPFKFTALHAYELAVIGQGPNTVIMPTPTFDGTTCAAGALHGCIFDDLNGGLGSPINTNDYLANFTVFGMGQRFGNVGQNMDGKSIINMPSLSVAQNINLVGWGWDYKSGAQQFTGIYQGSYSTLTGSIVNGAGNINLRGGSAGGTQANMPVAIGNFFGIARLYPCFITGYMIMKGNSCYGGGVSNNNVAEYVNTSTAHLFSSSDTFNGLIYGDTAGYGYFDGAIVQANSVNGAIWNQGANFFLKHTRDLTNSGGGTSLNQSSGTFTNEGGNAFPNNLSITGGTYLANQNFLKGSCTGVGTAASTLGLYNTGPNVTLTTCTSTTIGSGVLTQGTHTLQNLIVTATAAGTNASSGVVTVLVNGAGSVVTCTIGTGTSCQDGTHSVALVDGDRVSIQFTTQAADTLAGVKAFVEWN